MACCILSKFYIKPQLIPRSDGAGYVVSYRNSTSNHNSSAGWRTPAGLYLIEILHQTTTGVSEICLVNVLYLIEILHQTTTFGSEKVRTSELYLIEILHQTTTPRLLCLRISRCILSKFYIKPQHARRTLRQEQVVSYRNSTSNHNWANADTYLAYVVSYRNSTSNHNSRNGRVTGFNVVSYRNSTSNHNIWTKQQLTNKVVSYRNSTSNHNNVNTTTLHSRLYLIEILHQTTTTRKRHSSVLCCILSKFYIKPQPSWLAISLPVGCILSKFYIKPQP